MQKKLSNFLFLGILWVKWGKLSSNSCWDKMEDYLAKKKKIRRNNLPNMPNATMLTKFQFHHSVHE